MSSEHCVVLFNPTNVWACAVQHEDAKDGDIAPLKGKIAESGEAADVM